MIENTDKKEFNLAKNASKAFLWNHGLYVINSILLGLTTYLLARYLEPAGYGIFAATMAFGSAIALLISFGFEGALNIHLPRLRDNKPKLRYLFKQLLVRRLIIITVFFFFMMLMSITFKNLWWLPRSLIKLNDYMYLAVICGLISLISGLITRALITLFKVKYFVGIRVTYLTFNLMLYFFLLDNGYGIKGILWGTIATSLMAVILYVYTCRDLLIGTTKRFSLIKIHKFGITVWTTTILSYFLGKELDIIIMTICGVSALHIGFYQIVFILISYARMIVTKGMTGVLQSAFSTAYHKGGVENLGKWWMMTMKFQILVVSPGVLFLILFAHQIFQSVLPKYTDATLLLQIFGSFALIITVIGGGTHITALYAIGKEKIVLYTRILAGSANLFLDIILIYHFGVVGAIIATGLSGILIGCLELFLIFNNLGTKYPIAFLLKCSICLVVAGSMTSILMGSGILILFFYGLSYISVYIVSAWLIKPLDKEDIVRLSAVNSRLSHILVPFSTNSKIVSIESL